MPTRSDTDYFSSLYSGTENCAGLIFSLDMPVRQGSRRMPAQCMYTVMPETTLMIRVAIRECVKAPLVIAKY